MGERLLSSLLVIAAAVCTGLGVVVAPLGMLAVLLGLAFCWFFLRVPSRLVYLLLALLPFHMIIRFYHPFLVFWKEAVAVLLIAASLGVLYAGRRRATARAPRAANPLSALLFVMLAAHVAWVLVRFAVMDSKTEGLTGLQQHVLWPLSFVAMTLLLRSVSEYTLALRLWIAAAVVVSALGIYESAFLAPRGWFFSSHGFMQFEGTIRVSSTFDNPLSLGSFLALLLPLLVTQTAGARSRTARIALWGAVFVTSLTVVLTVSRGPMVQALVGTLLALALLRAFDRRYLRSLFVAALAFVAVGAVAIQFVPEIGARIVSVTDWRRDEGNQSRDREVVECPRGDPGAAAGGSRSGCRRVAITRAPALRRGAGEPVPADLRRVRPDRIHPAYAADADSAVNGRGNTAVRAPSRTVPTHRRSDGSDHGVPSRGRGAADHGGEPGAGVLLVRGSPPPLPLHDPRGATPRVACRWPPGSGRRLDERLRLRGPAELQLLA